MTKNILLAATAASVMAFAGAASAHTLTFRGATAGAIDSTEVGATGFRLAEEALATVSGDFAVNVDLSGTSTFPSGNNIIQIDLFGGVFATGGITSADVVAAGCTVVLSSGGAAGTTFARFLVSSSGGSCGAADLDLPVRASSTGDVIVRTTLETEGATPIDPDSTNTATTLGIPTAANQEVLRLIDRVNAFQVFINGDLDPANANDADADTIALLANPVYTTLGGDNILGTVWLSVDTTAHYDLNPANFVTVGDVTDATVTVEGNVSAFNAAATPPELDGVDADNVSTTEVSFENATFIAAPASAPDYDNFTVTPDGGVIQTSDYEVDVEYVLNTARYNEDMPMPAEGDFERIQREGTNVILPWMNSNRIQTTNGTSNFVRIANLSSQPAVVSGDVRTSNAADSGYTDNGIRPLGTVPAGGELQITTAALTAAMGDFGRGDVELIIEADPENITVRRFLVRPEGITELNSGTVASDQTPDDSADVP